MILVCHYVFPLFMLIEAPQHTGAPWCFIAGHIPIWAAVHRAAAGRHFVPHMCTWLHSSCLYTPPTCVGGPVDFWWHRTDWRGDELRIGQGIAQGDTLQAHLMYRWSLHVIILMESPITWHLSPTSIGQSPWMLIGYFHSPPLFINLYKLGKCGLCLVPSQDLSMLYTDHTQGTAYKVRNYLISGSFSHLCFLPFSMWTNVSYAMWTYTVSPLPTLTVYHISIKKQSPFELCYLLNVITIYIFFLQKLFIHIFFCA